MNHVIGRLRYMDRAVSCPEKKAVNHSCNTSCVLALLFYFFFVFYLQVKLFILHMKEYDFEDPQDALVHENTHSTLYSTKNYDFLKKEDRRDLLQAMGLFASYKFSQSGMI